MCGTDEQKTTIIRMATQKETLVPLDHIKFRLFN